jgi:stage II sporulation protein D
MNLTRRSPAGVERAPLVSMLPVARWLALLFLALASAASGADAPRTRLAILKNLGAARISGWQLLVRDIYKYDTLYSSSEAAGIQIGTSGGRLTINGGGTSSRHAVVTSGGPDIEINGRHFRGRLELVAEQGASGSTSLTVVNEVDLESYLVGLINYEVSSAWEIEAVKAQAVVARTYALYQMKEHINQFFDLETTVNDQVYGGSQAEDKRAREAVDATRGQALVRGSDPIQSFFHSCCGGMTESPLEVWGKDLPFFPVKKCPYCSNAPNYFWKLTLSASDIESALKKHGLKPGSIRGLSVAKRDHSGRVSSIRVDGSSKPMRISGVEFRRMLGYGVLKSTLFQLRSESGNWTFSGSGSGHGVGMCQWGAKGMAEQGSSYKQILDFYYTGVSLNKLY